MVIFLCLKQYYVNNRGLREFSIVMQTLVPLRHVAKVKSPINVSDVNEFKITQLVRKYMDLGIIYYIILKYKVQTLYIGGLIYCAALGVGRSFSPVSCPAKQLSKPSKYNEREGLKLIRN